MGAFSLIVVINFLNRIDMTLETDSSCEIENGPSMKKPKTDETEISLEDATNESLKSLPFSDTTDVCESSLGTHSVSDEPSSRAPKKKAVAMLMSFYGKDFFGMQVTRTPNCLGIEDIFCRHLVDAKVIKEEDYKNFGNMHFQRSCRTDKHVSAARQVISFKMFETPNAVELINSFLPKSIRVHDFVKLTKGFDCKKWASSRIYSYIVPSYCFQHKDQFDMDKTKLFRADEALVKRINEV